MANKENIILVKTKVYIDSIPHKVYDAYIEKDVDWNGWVCPWFTKEIVEEILSDCEYDWGYYEQKDCFMYHWPDDDADDDVVFGQDISVNGTQEHLYPLGNKSWIWAEFETKNKIEKASEDEGL